MLWSLLRKNHSGMETTYEIEAYEKYRNELRKNHSGMETGLLYGCLSFRRIRCVRTIVVWKRRIRRNREILGHCCVRTIVVWKPKGYRIVQSSDKVLRKNHSGMETITDGGNSARPMGSCVRTIVVWKLLPSLYWDDYPNVLRENHSGI